MRFPVHNRHVPGASRSHVRGHNLLNSLVEWWPLSEQSSTRLGVHAGLHLSDVNSVTGADGIGSLASQFTAANSETLELSATTGILPASSPFTITYWVNHDSLSSFRKHVGVWEAVTGSQRAFLVAWNDTSFSPNNRLMFLVSTDGSTSSTVFANAFGAISTGTWYMVAVGCTGSAMFISVNASARETNAFPSAIHASTASLVIGASNTPRDSFFDGKMQRLGLWHRELTDAEILSLFNGGRGRDYPFS